MHHQLWKVSMKTGHCTRSGDGGQEHTRTRALAEEGSCDSPPASAHCWPRVSVGPAEMPSTSPKTSKGLWIWRKAATSGSASSLLGWLFNFFFLFLLSAQATFYRKRKLLDADIECCMKGEKASTRLVKGGSGSRASQHSYSEGTAAYFMESDHHFKIKKKITCRHWIFDGKFWFSHKSFKIRLPCELEILISNS